MNDFSQVLQATLTPVALISGVGLLLLSMVNRYNHAIDRIRKLLKEKPSRSPEDWIKVEKSIAIIYRRCQVMRLAILCIGGSIVASGAMVFVSALEGIVGVDAYLAKVLLLVLSVGLVVIAAVLFVIEVNYSLSALRIELEE